MVKPPLSKIKGQSLYSMVYYANRFRLINHPTHKIGDKEKLNDILESVCNVFGVDKNEVKSKRRNRELVILRQIYCYLAAIFTTATMKHIGLFIGGKDHSTVIHAKNTIRNYMSARDSSFYYYWDKWIENAPAYLIP